MLVRDAFTCRRWVLVLAMMLVSATPAAVQATDWSNVNGGNFSTGSNWIGGTAPFSGDAANFTTGALGGYTVTFTSSTSTFAINMSDDVMFLLGNHQYATSGSILIASGASATAQLIVREGQLISNTNLHVGQGASAQGNLTVSTGGVVISEDVRLGAPRTSTDTLVIESGGLFISGSSIEIDSASSATASVTDTGSTALFEQETVVGKANAGALSVQNGALLNSTGTFTIAQDAASTGAVTLSTTGADPTWNHSNGPILFGLGTGTMTISSGALNVSGTGADITLGASDAMTLSGGSLNVSGAGLGNGLTLNSGATLTIDNSVSALNVSSTGTGSGISLNSGATLSQSAGTITTSNFTRAGTFTHTGGTFAVDGGVFNNSAATFNFAAGGGEIAFQLLNGATTTGITTLNVGTGGSATRAFDVLSGSTLSTSAASTIGQSGTGSATLRVSGAGSTWNANSFINVGQVTGTLVVEDGGAVNTNGNPLQTGTSATGIATLTIQDGGSISTFASVNLGLTVGSTTVATVTGNGSTLGATNVFIGGSNSSDGGTASLTIGPGAEVNVSTQTRIRTPGTLNISGGNLNTFNFTRTGTFNFTDGTLTMTGGTFSNNSTDITLAGNGVGTNPTLVFQGGTTSSGITNLNVGSSSQRGTATINVGSTLATGAVTIASQGEMNLQGGTLALSSFTNSGTFNWTSGAVRFANGSTASDATLTGLLGTAHSLGNGKSLTGLGTLALGGNLSVDGGAVSGVTTLTNNATLTLNQGSVSVSTLSNSANKVVQVNGTTNLNATTAISNSGQLRLTSETASLSGGTLSNNAGGTISGTGVIGNTLQNEGTVRATGAEHLVFTGTGGINVLNMNLVGGTIEFTDDLFNRDGAAITGRGAFVGSSANPGGAGLTNEGLMSFSAGTMDIYGDVDNDATGRIVTGGGGVTTFYDDVIHNGMEIRTFAGSTTVFFGNQSGAGSFTGTGVVEYVGDLRPGNSPATVSYEGDVLFNSSASLIIELGGLTAGTQHDKIDVEGSLSLDGTLEVSLINSFSPTAGDSFDILDWGSLSGTFDALSLPALNPGLMWNASQLYAIGTLKVGLAGDYNLNGVVDAADYVVWRNSLGQVGTALAADGNANGSIDPGDFNVWRSNFGQTAGSGASLQGSAGESPIPEPSSAVLVCIILVAAASHVGRRTQRR